MDDKDGVYFNATFLITKKNFPLSVSALINKPLKSNIPSEYDFLWNVGLIYSFNKYLRGKEVIIKFKIQSSKFKMQYMNENRVDLFKNKQLTGFL